MTGRVITWSPKINVDSKLNDYLFNFDHYWIHEPPSFFKKKKKDEFNQDLKTFLKYF